MVNIHFLKKVLKSYINYKIRTDRLTPFFASFQITNRCNLQCKYCIFHSKKETHVKGDLSSKDILQIVKRVIKSDIGLVAVTGGEPLIREDLEEIGKILSQNDIFLTLSTNGTLVTHRRAKELSKYFDLINISLDGPKEIHNKLRAEYKKTVKAIKVFLRNRTKSKVGIHTTISKENYQILPRFIKRWENEVDYMSFHIPLFQPEYLPPNTLAFRQVLHRLVEIRRNKPTFILNSERFLQMIPNYLETRTSSICDAIRLYIGIAPNGDVYPCPLPQKSIGNLLEKDLKEIVKNKFKKEGCEARCLTPCTTEISLLFRGTPFKHLKKIKVYF